MLPVHGGLHYGKLKDAPFGMAGVGCSRPPPAGSIAASTTTHSASAATQVLPPSSGRLHCGFVPRFMINVSALSIPAVSGGLYCGSKK